MRFRRGRRLPPIRTEYRLEGLSPDADPNCAANMWGYDAAPPRLRQMIADSADPIILRPHPTDPTKIVVLRVVQPT
jgi:hypothetical protein